MIAFRGQKKIGPRPDWSPLGVYFKIYNEHPHPFHMQRPPPWIVSNGCNTVLTMQCFVADPSNITFKPGGVCYLNESDTSYSNSI